MDHPNRGLALIFNFDEFEPHLKLDPRRGSDMDVAELRRVLTMPTLRFEVPEIPNNLTVDGLWEEVENYVQMDHTASDCIMIFILTHGDGKDLYAKDKKFEFDSIWKAFNAKTCPSLEHKPKLFFLQACQGKTEQPMVLSTTQCSRGPFGSSSSCEPQAPYIVPIFSDFLLAYSTIPGYCSFRHPDEGSLYIQSLCEGFQKSDEFDSITDIILYANRKVTAIHGNYWGKSQLPSYTSQLRRKVRFH